jgi:hypothetical protein
MTWIWSGFVAISGLAWIIMSYQYFRRLQEPTYRWKPTGTILLWLIWTTIVWAAIMHQISHGWIVVVISVFAAQMIIYFRYSPGAV